MKDNLEYPYCELRLYIAGRLGRSASAVSNLAAIRKEYLLDRCRIDVIDLLENPHLSREDNVVAVPMLVRCLPKPVRKIIGDLSDAERVLSILPEK